MHSPSCRCLRHLLVSHSPPPYQNSGYGPAPPPPTPIAEHSASIGPQSWGEGLLARLETGEAIVVGAIGSAVPWFLTGWAHEVEIEFIH